MDMLDETWIPKDVSPRVLGMWDVLPDEEKKAVKDSMAKSNADRPGAYFTALVSKRLCKPMLDERRRKAERYERMEHEADEAFRARKLERRRLEMEQASMPDESRGNAKRRFLEARREIRTAKRSEASHA